jgi:hypothetical protein
MEQHNDVVDDAEIVTKEELLGVPGLEALKRERLRRKELERELDSLKVKIESGDVLAFELQESRSAIARLEKERETLTASFQQQLDDKDGQIKSIHLERNFRSAASKHLLNPKYIDTIYAAHKGDFIISSDNSKIATIDEKSIDDWFEAKRDEYPELFQAPGASGTGIGASNDGRRRSRIISRNDNASVIANLDAIAKGEIVLGD